MKTIWDMNIEEFENFTENMHEYVKIIERYHLEMISGYGGNDHERLDFERIEIDNSDIMVYMEETWRGEVEQSRTFYLKGEVLEDMSFVKEIIENHKKSNVEVEKKLEKLRVELKSAYDDRNKIAHEKSEYKDSCRVSLGELNTSRNDHTKLGEAIKVLKSINAEIPTEYFIRFDVAKAVYDRLILWQEKVYYKKIIAWDKLIKPIDESVGKLNSQIRELEKKILFIPDQRVLDV